MFEIGSINLTGRRVLRKLIQTRARTNLASSARADPSLKPIEEAEVSSEPGTRAFVLCLSFHDLRLKCKPVQQSIHTGRAEVWRARQEPASHAQPQASSHVPRFPDLRGTQQRHSAPLGLRFVQKGRSAQADAVLVEESTPAGKRQDPAQPVAEQEVLSARPPLAPQEHGAGCQSLAFVWPAAR